MSQQSPQQAEAQEIRAIYEEYTLDDTRVAMISDPENEYAWIQSDHTTELIA